MTPREARNARAALALLEAGFTDYASAVLPAGPAEFGPVHMLLGKGRPDLALARLRDIAALAVLEGRQGASQGPAATQAAEPTQTPPRRRA